MLGDIAQGRNPAEERRAVREEATLGEVFEDFVEKHGKLHKKTWQADIAMFT